MCGRAYETYTEEELYYRYLNQKPVEFPSFRPNYNFSPTQTSLILRMVDNERRFDVARWGLIPFWAKDLASVSKYSLINAKCEEIEVKKSYADSFLKRRCIVPLSGFVEWAQTEKPKRPFAVHLKDKQIMSVAAVWEHWTSKQTSESILSFTMVTTEANDLIQNIHTRMPVILKKEDEDLWLDPTENDPKKLKSLFKPYPPEEMAMYEISTKINSPKNNSEDLLQPLSK